MTRPSVRQADRAGGRSDSMAGNAVLGTLTQWVQVLAGILLPSAILFLVLLCNDKQVLGPWVNKTWQNVIDFTIIGVLIVLSLILVVSTLFKSVNGVVLTEALFAAAAGASWSSAARCWRGPGGGGSRP